MAAATRKDLNGNNNPSSCRCACSPTPILLVLPPDRRRCRICNRRVCCRPPDRAGWTAVGFADVYSRGVNGPARISCIDVDCSIDNATRSRRHRTLLPPPGTSSWDWQVATAWCRCTTRPTLRAACTCTTIAVTTKTDNNDDGSSNGGGGWDMMSEFWVILGACTKLVTVCDLLLGRGRSN